jgi:isopenicillin-N N-acyltransferase-like protein
MTTHNHIPFHHWSGSPFEIGRNHGRTLKEQIIIENGPAAHALANKLNLSLSAALTRIVEIYEPLYHEHFPTAIEEIKGITSGANLSYPFAFFSAIRDGLGVNVEQCTSFVCGSNTTKEGNLLIGQTKDTLLSIGRYHFMKYEYESGRRLFILNYPGWAANMTLTSDGMAFTGNSLYAESPTGKTVPFSFLKRAVMEKSSVSEFLKTIEGLSFQNACFLVADRTGKAICIESVAGKMNIRDVSNSAFGHANSILSGELKSLEDPAQVSISSESRQKNIQRSLDSLSGRITVEELKKVTADHTDYPLSICRHPFEQDPSSTTAAIIMDITNLEAHVALENPCCHAFETYKL